MGTKGAELGIDLDYGSFTSDRNSFQPNIYLGPDGNELGEASSRMITPTDISVISGKADYSRKLGKGKLGFGGKFSIVSTENSFNFYDVEGSNETFNEDRSNQFE